MPDKIKILKAWIMVEHLSEGDIKPDDKDMYKFSRSNDNNYYALFSDHIYRKLTSKHKKNAKKKGGIIAYFDIFNFKEVVSFLREKYHLAKPVEEPRVGSKFGLALCFDEDLNFVKDMTYYTASEYIRKKSKIPSEAEFHNFEADLKTDLTQNFERPDNDDEPYEPKFNKAINDLFELLGTTPDKCRFKVLQNLENDAVNLHSFFINDLEYAKKTDTPNLTSYLFGYDGDKIDLDSKSSSSKFAPAPFEDILRPQNYPLGRFPSNTQFALSLMQQVAVNLSLGYDNRQIRSVNGPPGTGKTTLLKDIFAELIVRQSAHMCAMTERRLKGNKDTVYFNNSSIAELPPEIADNGIVVASYNNGAVQNIVKELPLLSAVDEKLLDELKEADYFYKLSNCKLSSKWVDKPSGGKEEVLVCEETDEPDKYWGLFSLEGGRSENMSHITTSIKHINKYLEEEYVSDEDVYEQFLKDQKAVAEIRAKAENYALSRQQYDHDRLSLKISEERLAKAQAEYAACTEKAKKALNNKLSSIAAEKKAAEDQLAVISAKRTQLDRDRTQLQCMLDAAASQKPSFFAGKEKKKAYDETIAETNIRLLSAIKEDSALADSELAVKARLKSLDDDISAARKHANDLVSSCAAKVANIETELKTLQNSTASFEQKFADSSAKPLDMSLPYDKLQLSAPWFDEAYRIAQSRLFISALRVRKQFLFENVKNLRAALSIWYNQSKHIDNNRIIMAAWNWINLAIPVISSTFASFSRMCTNLYENSLGHLFVDEAGQAAPQHALGAIMRSKHVMVVGDPSQIKPVLTLDGSVLKMLCTHYEITEKYLSENASCQTLTDQASRFGYYYSEDKSEDSWIGIPLWVHRRCGYPMFTISNKISYHNMMVQGKEYNGRTGWYNVKGTANDKYVAEQGDFLAAKISAMMRDDPEIGDKNVKDKIYVISPFSNVAYMLARRLKSIGFTRYDKDGKKATNIGTIHTFQGKEADIVFMVLGADSRSKGSAKWAVTEPNMMNVAATRAKKQFYIVGDRELYQNLGCDVSDDTISIMRKYAKDHPELIDEEVVMPAPQQNTAHTANRPAPQQNTTHTAGRPTPQQNTAHTAGRPAPQQNTTHTAGRPAPQQNTPHTASRPTTQQNTTQTAAAVKLTGTVISVHDAKGGRSKYAFVAGSDGKRYTISDSVYSSTPDAESIITEGAQVSFRPAKQSEKHNYADTVEKI